jgi:hypothetical protein
MTKDKDNSHDYSYLLILNDQDWIEKVYETEAQMKSKDPKGFGQLNAVQSLKQAVLIVDESLHPLNRRAWQLKDSGH